MRYRLVTGPGWLRVDAESGLVWGTPEEVGVVEIEAYDEQGETVRQRYRLYVLPVPSAGTPTGIQVSARAI